MTNIYLVRHAQSIANAGGVTMAHLEIPLSSAGVMQAEALAAALEVGTGQLRASAFVRALETARPFAAKRNTPVVIDPLLNEFSCLDEALIGKRSINDALAGIQGT